MGELEAGGEDRGGNLLVGGLLWLVKVATGYSGLSSNSKERSALCSV